MTAEKRYLKQYGRFLPEIKWLPVSTPGEKEFIAIPTYVGIDLDIYCHEKKSNDSNS